MSLLPPNSTALERAIEATIRARLDALTVPLRALWSVADCPAAMLPHLAWSLAVDAWDSLWGETYRRAIIGAAIDIARRRGTLGSLRRVLAAAGQPDAIITEGAYSWRVGDGSRVGDHGLAIGYRGSWAYYRVQLMRSITNAQGSALRAACEATAPARCGLSFITYPWAPWVVGDGTAIGSTTIIPTRGGNL